MDEVMISIDLVRCKCTDNSTMTISRRSGAFSEMIVLQCGDCGMGSGLHLTIKKAAITWNGCFGKRAKKEHMTWNLPASWKTFYESISMEKSK